MNTQLQPTTPTLIQEDEFLSIPIQTHKGPLISSQMCRIKKTTERAIMDHNRTMAVRVDLRAPHHYPAIDINFITRFMSCLNSQLKSDAALKKSQGKRVHPCHMRYVWAREQDKALNAHYHICLFFNMDRYNSLGYYDAISGNLSARIKQAWADALGIKIEYLDGAVHFPKNGIYKLNAGTDDFEQHYLSLLYRLSYLAKLDTKAIGGRHNSFGCSLG